MEMILWFLIIVLVVIIYFGVKFVSFKSKLMNELGRRGIDHNAADALYSLWANKINTLHQNGTPVSTIADMIYGNVEVGQPYNGISPSTVQETEVSFPYQSYEEWFEAFQFQCEREKPSVAKFVDFVDQDPLQLAFQDKQDPRSVALLWIDSFDPIAMLNDSSKR